MKLFKIIWNVIKSFFLNKKSSKLLEWSPTWFGEDGYSKKLADKISKFQKSYGIEETGIVDVPTIRRRATEKEALTNILKAFANEHSEDTKSSILCNGKYVGINWEKVILFKEADGLQISDKNFKKHKSRRKPTMFVAHWDVCLSSKSCFKILEKRGLSVHFLIDNDGTIYQIMDCNDIGWHAGNRKVNNKSVGVEISNAYYPKYQEIYRRKGFGPRPMLQDIKVHGKKLKGFLGFYDVQIEAFKALAEALNKTYDIPLVAPMENNKLIETTYSKVQDATFKGVVSHYHITTRKIDCAGLKLDEVLK
tara:strand:+ start:478 stop:1398 length:921 start_codon:yes stop_codon:yes gene_type:complete